MIHNGVHRRSSRYCARFVSAYKDCAQYPRGVSHPLLDVTAGWFIPKSFGTHCFYLALWPVARNQDSTNDVV
jgi:hypothetical protein